MIQPRNTLVVVRLIEKADRKVGKIVVPTNADIYCEAEVVSVGPGNVSAGGGRSETFDLKPGQRVWVKHKTRRPGPAGGHILTDEGIVYQDDDDKVILMEQTSILGIIADPGEDAKVPVANCTIKGTVTVGCGGVVGVDNSVGKSIHH